MFGKLRDSKTLRTFLRDERGGPTIEFVLWIPGFAVLLIVTADASVLYLTHTEMWNVARDTARRVAIGDITDAQAPAAAKASLPANYNYQVTSSPSSASEVFVEIQVPIADAAAFGVAEIFNFEIWGDLISKNLVARVTMRREPT